MFLLSEGTGRWSALIMKKILVITLELGHNYGGILQAYALQQVVRKLGYEPVTSYTQNQGPLYKQILRRVPGLKAVATLLRPSDAPSTAATRAFVSQNIPTVPVPKRRRDFAKFAMVVVGSDQVWRAPYASLFTSFLIRAPRDLGRIAYAASFGKDNILEYNFIQRQICRRLIKRFNGVSAREQSGVAICANDFGVVAKRHVDPTMLLERAQYLELVAQGEALQPELFTYILDDSSETRRLVEEGTRLVGLEPFDFIKECDEGCSLLPVGSWISGIANASYVLTDSFHGTVFSILFNKPFLTFSNPDRGQTRMESLLELFGLEDRLISDPELLTEEIVAKPIDWGSVNNVLEREKERSRDFLREHMEVVHCPAQPW
ncbi:MAG: polysaccharide pyruvyl transferase family protein [Ancrocorticia sp.]